MIANQNKGRGFRGTLNYLWYGSATEPKNRDDVHLIGGNMAGRNPRELSAEFGAIRQLRPGLKRAVYHVSLSLHPNERLSDDAWRLVAGKYLQDMGFGNSQWVMVRHSDEAHAHVHIVASRITLDGSVVPDKNDYHRSAVVVQQIERQYGLTPAAHTPRQAWQQPVKSISKKAYQWAGKTGKPSPRMAVQIAILQEVKHRPTMSQLADRLAGKGIGIKLNIATTGKVTGISFVVEGAAVKGSSLGKAFSWHGLQHHLGIRYHPDRDNPILQQIQSSQITIPLKIPLPKLSKWKFGNRADVKNNDPVSPPPGQTKLSETIHFLNRAVNSFPNREKGKSEEEEKDRSRPVGRNR